MVLEKHQNNAMRNKSFKVIKLLNDDGEISEIRNNFLHSPSKNMV